MKTVFGILGTVFIILGIMGFYDRYVIYNSREQIAEIGDVEITAKKEKTIVIPPLASAVSLGAGILFAIMALKSK